MSIFKELMAPTKIGVMFRSYWVHMLVQVIVLYFVLGNEGATLVLVILTSSYFLMFLYLFFQFPLTGLIVVISHQIMMRYSQGQGLMFRIIFSTGLFIIFATITAFLIIHIYSIGRLNALNFEFSYWEEFGEHWNLILTYLTPIFLVGEVLRQRITLKKVYGNENAEK